MQKIRHWLRNGPSFRLFLCCLPVLVVFCWNLAQTGIATVSSIAPDLVLSGNTRNYALELQTREVHEIALRSFVATPLREELLFRMLPFGVVWGWWARYYNKAPPLWLAISLVVATSVVFGYIHGGIGNVFIQGLIGVVIASVFLVWGSYGKTPLRGIASILVLHGSYNFYVAMLS